MVRPALILIFLLMASPVFCAQETESYGKQSWNSFKKTSVKEILGLLEKAFTSRSALQTYYYRKYSPPEREAAARAVESILTACSEEDRDRAVQEVLAFHYVVYHQTDWHRLDRNTALVREYEETITHFSSLHEVPAPLVKAVISWENSGTTSSISYAACAGLGQLSWGAVHRAHRQGGQKCRALRAEAARQMLQYKKTGDASLKIKAENLKKEALLHDLEIIHRKKALRRGIRDERLDPECNIEDTVLFIKYLLSCFDSHADFTIAAYHNGLANMNELLIDYITRWVPWMLSPSLPEKTMIVDSIRKYNITYLSLWNDERSREMLSGYRTMDGDITNSSNRREALGDESDIYLWKVLGAYGAFLSSPGETESLMTQYRGRWDTAECRGLPVYLGGDEVAAAVKDNRLVMIPAVIKDCGIGTLRGAPPAYTSACANLNYYVTPELAGFIHHLWKEYAAATGSKKAFIPVANLLKCKCFWAGLSKDTLESDRNRTHLQGVACDIPLSQSINPALLRQLLNRCYLSDRIYLINEGDSALHICLNPRFGNEFYRYYSELRMKPKKEGPQKGEVPHNN